MTSLAGGLLLLLALHYAAAIGRFAAGFRRVLRAEAAARPDAGAPAVSVIVPARNEAAGIESCLHAILASDYPPDRLEVIVVDDLSEDATPALVRRLAARYHRVPAGEADEDPPPRLQLVRMPENRERDRAHKKRAIEKGVARARGEIILTTDADCRVGPRWVRRMAARFDERTGFVSGPVLYRVGRGPIRRMLALEHLGLVALGAGAIGAGRPNLCNGANVAYRKRVFEEAGGFRGIDHLSSGDDELLMQKIAAGGRWAVRFCADPEAVVVTEAAGDARAFFEQRRRWASKGAHYPSLALIALIVAVYLFYAGLLAAGVAALRAPGLRPFVGIALALKIAAELSLLAQACRHFRRRRLLALFLPAQLLQIPYVVVIGLAGLFGGYRWKGRTVAR